MYIRWSTWILPQTSLVIAASHTKCPVAGVAMGINCLAGIAALSSLTPHLPRARGMRLLIVYVRAPVYPQAVLLAPILWPYYHIIIIIQFIIPNEQPLLMHSIPRQ